MRKKTILIAGGAGFIGSQVNKMLYQAGYQTVVLDNLSRGHRTAVLQGDFIKGDIADSIILDHIFQNRQIDAVMHFAAKLNVGESVRNPALYYHNNVAKTLNLLHSMVRHSVDTLIFSSSASIFGIPHEERIREQHPLEPINPYGKSKLMVERILRDFEDAYGLKSCCLRYFNAAGGDPEGKIPNDKTDEFNLIPVTLLSLLEPTSSLTIFGDDYPTGDGTCIRDYIHIYDIGKAHILAMEKLFEDEVSTAYNLGNGQGFSVKEVIQTIETVTGHPIFPTIGPRRPGDPAILVADSAKAQKELGWKLKYPALDSIISHAWQAVQHRSLQK